MSEHAYLPVRADEVHGALRHAQQIDQELGPALAGSQLHLVRLATHVRATHERLVNASRNRRYPAEARGGFAAASKLLLPDTLVEPVDNPVNPELRRARILMALALSLTQDDILWAYEQIDTGCPAEILGILAILRNLEVAYTKRAEEAKLNERSGETEEHIAQRHEYVILKLIAAWTS